MSASQRIRSTARAKVSARFFAQSSLKQVLIVHGPNLNLLGEREPDVYGSLTLSQIDQSVRKFAKTAGIAVQSFQSNHEGEIIDNLHKARHWAQGIVINPGAYTHYSYAIRDAIASIAVPTVEVHLSDIKKREPFRRKSVIAPVCVAQIFGLGWQSYIEGIKALMALSRGDEHSRPVEKRDRSTR